MIQTGDETDALLAESLSTAELQLFERAKLTKAFKSYHVLAREENILPCFRNIGCKYILKYAYLQLLLQQRGCLAQPSTSLVINKISLILIE